MERGQRVEKGITFETNKSDLKVMREKLGEASEVLDYLLAGND